MGVAARPKGVLCRYNSLALQKFLELMFSDPEDMTSLDRAGLAPMVLPFTQGSSALQL